MDAGQANVLVAELGRQLGIADLALDEGATCTLFVDDGAVIVSFGFNKTAQAIDLMICLDAVEPATAPLALLLRANFSWLGSRGATFAIEPASGALVLQRRVAGNAVHVAELRQALEELVAAADAWAKRLAAETAAAGEAPASAPADRKGIRHESIRA